MSSAAMVTDEKVLARMRKMLGLRQVQVADAVGFNRVKLSQWENGLVELSAQELKAISDYFHQVALQRSEAGTLPAVTDVPQTSAERGRQFRDQRLTWNIPQGELVPDAELPDSVISMFENGYSTLESQELERLSKALARAIDKRQSQLAWHLNPAELRLRRENLGISRKRLARHVGQSEDWLVDIEGGRIPLTTEIGNPLWEFIAETELSLGKVAPLAAALSAPVVMPQLVSSPPSAHKLERLEKLRKRLAEQAEKIHNLEKQAKILQEMCNNEAEKAALLHHIVTKVEPKVIEMQGITGGMAPSKDRDRLCALLKDCEDAINE